MEHHHLLENVDDGAVDLDGALYLHPRQAVGVGHTGEDMICGGIHAQDDEEESAPSTVFVGRPGRSV